eukprot:jgi/Tetstr1/466936/TSEL_011390.t1
MAADIINASRILGDRRDVRQLTAFVTDFQGLTAGIYWTPALKAWILHQFPLESNDGMANPSLLGERRIR